MLNASNEARPSGRVIYRKIVLRLIPFLVVCDILSVIDRLNIGFAKLQFMHDLSLNEAVVGMAAGVFYFGFTIFEIPSNFMLEKFGIRKTLLRIMAFGGWQRWRWLSLRMNTICTYSDFFSERQRQVSCPA